MKISLIIGILVVYSTAFSQNQMGAWRTLANAPVTNGRFDDVFFIDPATGWIVEVATSKIYKTTNGGKSWDEILDADEDLGYHVGFRCIGFVNDQVGWSGNLNFHNSPVPRRSLFETRDGGTTWLNISDRISGFDPAGICGLWVVNDQIICGAGRWNGPPVFIKSTDGGLSWTSKDLRPLVTGLVDVYFFNPDTGLVVGGNGVGSSLQEQNSSKSVILYTVDGGANWTTVYESTHTGVWCWKLSFPTRQIGYVSTQGAQSNGIVLKTTDGGLSWEEIVVGQGLGFSGIGFVSPSFGWVAADLAYETTNSGDSWQLVDNVGLLINRFRFYGDTLGYAVGRTVYKYTARGPVSVPGHPVGAVSDFRLEQNYPNPFNPTTTISYHLAETVDVELNIYNLSGQRIRTLLSGRKEAGSHSLAWDGKNDVGDEVASGLYLYKLRAGEFFQSHKMILIR